MVITLKDKTLTYYTDVQEELNVPTVLTFNLHVHVYDGHVFTFPSKISIENCKNEVNVASNPNALAEVETPFTLEEECGCYEPETSVQPLTTAAPDYKECAYKCFIDPDCKFSRVKSNPHSCRLYNTACTCF